MKRLYTAESVTEEHPDKLCNLIHIFHVTNPFSPSQGEKFNASYSIVMHI